jgi:hypothetical protein
MTPLGVPIPPLGTLLPIVPYNAAKPNSIAPLIENKISFRHDASENGNASLLKYPQRNESRTLVSNVWNAGD